MANNRIEALDISNPENMKKFTRTIKRTFWFALGVIILLVAAITLLMYHSLTS